MEGHKIWSDYELQSENRGLKRREVIWGSQLGCYMYGREGKTVPHA